jgi:hypothetical protein
MMRTVRKVALVTILGGALLGGGGSVLFASGAKRIQASANKHAITSQQFTSVHVGVTTRQEVLARLGLPQAHDDTPTTGGLRSCIWYNRRDHLTGIFQFCFDARDRLASKGSARV